MDGLLLILVVAFTLIGVKALLHGLRGRRVDDHPACSACQFDLIGSWPNSKTCPECGADLKSAGAVQHGQRRRRPAVVGIGAAMLLVTAALMFLAAFDSRLSINWNALKTDGWLVRDLRSTEAQKAEGALQELVQRDADESLSSSNRTALLDHIFDSIMPAYRTADVAWVPVVERAWCDGVLSVERRLVYAKGMSDHYLVLDHILSDGFYEGDVIGFGFGYHPRFGHRSKVMEFEIRPISIRLDDRAYDVFPTPTSFVVSPDQPTHTMGHLQWDIPVEAAAGESMLHLVWELTCKFDGDSDRAVSWEARSDVQLTIQPRVSQSFSVVSDDGFAETIRNAVHVNLAGIRHLTPNDEFYGLVGRVDIDEIDVRASFTVLIEDEDGTLVVTDAPVCMDGRGTAEFHVLAPRGREIDSLQLVLYASRPSPSGTTALDQEDRRHDDRPLWFGSPIRMRVPVQGWFESNSLEDFPNISISGGFEEEYRPNPDK